MSLIPRVVAAFLIASLGLAASARAGFVSVDDAAFTVDGQPFHVAGTNCYYLMVYAADTGLRSQVNEVLEEAALMGLNAIRTWGFNDGSGWNALQTAPGLYDEQVFQGLDYVLDRCDQLGLRVILPLVNNWTDYGGMDQYVSWSPTAAFHDDFYTDVNCRLWYRNHAAALIGRTNTINGRLYRDDPTILAWELANEPRCISDPSGNTLQAWVEEMSAHIRSLDPNHLIGTGSEGFYDDGSGAWYVNGSQGVDYLRNHATAGVDYAGAHSWPDHWGISTSAAVSLLERQVADATGLQRPFVLGEFGKARDASAARTSNHYDPATYFSPGVTPRPVPGAAPLTADTRRGPGFDVRLQGITAGVPTTGTTARDAFYTECFDTIHWNAAGGAVYWISYDNAYPDYDGFGVYYPDDTSTVSLIESFAEAMDSLSLTAAPPLPIPGPVVLGAAYPNPFARSLRVPLTVRTVAGGVPVTVSVHTALGRRLTVLLDGYLPNGGHEMTWDGLDARGLPAPAGVYFLSVRSGERRWSAKLLRSN